MSNVTVDTEALSSAARALQIYIEEVQNNIQKMRDAAVDCSDNMGSDIYSQKAISKLGECIKSLSVTINEAESLRTAILKRIQVIEESQNF